MPTNRLILSPKYRLKMSDVKTVDLKGSQSSSKDVSIFKLYTYDWTIDNYSMIKPVPEAACSPDFIVGLNNDLNMKLYLTPSANNNLKIEIRLTDAPSSDDKQSDPSKKLIFSKSILNLEFLDSNAKTIDYYMGLICESKDIDGKKNYIWRKEENVLRFIENDSLTIRSKLSLRYRNLRLNSNVELLLNDMKKIFENRNQFSDIAVKVGGRLFSTHRAILLTQCPSIAKLKIDSKDTGISVLEHDNKSPVASTKASKIIHIPNENADVFLSVLHYLYCGKIYISDSVNDYGIYEFAKKYAIRELSMFLMPSEIHCRSQIKVTKINFTWYVKNFSISSKTGFSPITSPTFQTKIGDETVVWNVVLFFFDTENIFLGLRRVSDPTTDIKATFKLIVCDAEGKHHDEREFKHLFTSISVSYPGFLDAESRFLINPNLLSNDTLSIVCDLTVPDGELTSEIKRTVPGLYEEIDITCWKKNLLNLLENENYADMFLSVDGKVFKAHKVILAARSPVFAKMFESDMVEKLSGSVTIEDISSSVMKRMLTYIYTSDLRDLTMTDAQELYRAADKYEILDLKESCASFIIQNINADSACEVFMLSDLFGDERMNKAARQLICSRASDALLTPQGMELMMNHPTLMKDILDSLSASYCSVISQQTYLFIPEIRNDKTSESKEKSIYVFKK